MSGSSNPVLGRLARLHAQWLAFAATTEARLLVWQVTAQEQTMLEAFVARETDEEMAETDDMFMRFTADFANPSAHGYALREELIRQHDALRVPFASEVEAAWSCPHARESDDDVRALLGALRSLKETYVAEGAHLAVWLDPEQVSDSKAHLLWLQRLVRAAPPELRFIVVESLEQPSYQPLLEAEPDRVQAARCELDMPALMVALAEGGDRDQPGAQFMLQLAKIGQAASAGDLLDAAAIATAATELALRQGWLHLAAVVQLTLGSAYSALGNAIEAASAYTEAERLAARCANQAGEDADLSSYGRPLQLQARFGQGAAMLACRAFKQAAEVYLQAAPLAETLGDARAELDCYRLASVCFDQDGQAEKAWDTGMRGFNVGLELEGETRAASTLPSLCQHLLRFTARQAAYRAHHHPLREHIERLLGPDLPSAAAVETAAP